MRHFFTLGAVTALAVACGGTSDIGNGLGGVHGDGGPGSGSGSKSGAGGATTGTGGAGTGTGAVKGTGGATGGQCSSMADCPQLGIACQQCPDGSQACPSVDCIGGKCVGSFPTCSVGSKCNSGAECAVPAICKVCPDGSPSCATGGCVNGQCTTTFPPCAGGNVCKADSDCPVPPVVCQPCPDGSCAPANTACVSGQCSTTIGPCTGGGGDLKWFATCGPPVCQADPPPSGLPACGPTDKVGASCAKQGMQCDTGGACAGPLLCSTTNPMSGHVCPL